jgi:hypothetical protein
LDFDLGRPNGDVKKGIRLANLTAVLAARICPGPHR